MDKKYFPDWWLYKEDKSNFLFWSALTLTGQLSKVAKPSGKNYSRNQATNTRSRNFCTVVAPICAILSYRWEERTDRDWEACRVYAQKNHWYKSSEGHYMSVGIDCARNYWNSINPSRKMLSFRATWNSEDYWTGINAGHHAVVWYRGNLAWNLDARDNSILNKTEHGEDVYWHIPRNIKGNDGYIIVKDNYLGRKSGNDYAIPVENMKDLPRWQDTWYYPSSYFFLPEKEISKVNPQILRTLLSMMSIRSTLWDKINDSIIMDGTLRAKMMIQLHEENKARKKLLEIE